MLFGFTGQSRI